MLRHVLGILVAAGLAHDGACYAAEEPPPAKLMDAAVTIEPIRESDTLTASAILVLTISNKNNLSLEIVALDLTTVPAWTLIHKIDTSKCDGLEVPANATNKCPISVVAVSASEDWMSWTTLFFSPDTYPLTATVTIESGTGEERDFFGETQMDLKPPLSSLLRGGVFGSLLMGLFVVVRRWRLGLETPSAFTVQDLGRVALEFLALLLFGAVVTSIAILLLQRLSGLDLPISIEVKDYLGAFVVGIMSLKVGDSLYELMFPATQNS